MAVGQPVLLLAEAFGRNAQAAAVRVSGFVRSGRLAKAPGNRAGMALHFSTVPFLISTPFFANSVYEF